MPRGKLSSSLRTCALTLVILKSVRSGQSLGVRRPLRFLLLMRLAVARLLGRRLRCGTIETNLRPAVQMSLHTLRRHRESRSLGPRGRLRGVAVVLGGGGIRGLGPTKISDLLVRGAE